VRTVWFATSVLLVGSVIAFARDTEPQGHKDETYFSASELASKVVQTVSESGTRYRAARDTRY